MAAIVNPVLGIEPALLWTDGRRRRSVLDSYGYMGVANIFLIFLLISIDSEFSKSRGVASWVNSKISTQILSYFYKANPNPNPFDTRLVYCRSHEIISRAGNDK